MAALSGLRCSVCHKTGGNHCMSCKQPGKVAAENRKFSAESEEKLIRILAEVSTELGYRNVPLRVMATS